MNPRAIADAFGGQEVLGVDVVSQLDLVELSSRGIPKAALVRLAQSMGIPVSRMVRLLPITERTLQRYSAKRVLSQPVTEQALHLAELHSKGRDVFEDDERFRAWLSQPSRALGNRIPFDLLRSRYGIQMALDELVRIEHGVVA